MSNERADFVAALAFAHENHRNQYRKGTDIPYVSHPMAVAALVMEAGGTQEEIIAALLHDTIEDCADVESEDIAERFGERVAEIVVGLSDASLKPGEEKPAWKTRKEDYLRHLRACTDQSICLVSLADKLHNTRSILADLNDPSVGEAVWSRFNAKRERQLWYYHELVKIFSEKAANPRLVRALEETVAAFGD